MNKQDIKLELIQWLSTLEDSNIIKKIVASRRSESRGSWDEISGEEKKALEQGLKDADAGKFNPHSSARKLYEKWL